MSAPEHTSPTAWDRWVAFVHEPVDSRPMVLIRLAVTAVIIADMLSIFLRRADDAVLWPVHLGGMVQRSAPWFLLDGFDYAGPMLWITVLVSMVMAHVGVAMRPALLVGVIAHAQLGHMWIPGDRAIDRILRTALLILLFSEVSKARVPRRIPRWSADLVTVLVVCIFMGAARAKVRNNGLDWLGARHPHELYVIMTSGINGRLDQVFWYDHQAPFIFMGWATMIVELSVFVVLTRFSPWWAIFGAVLHLGIAATMDLGIFSFGMLALYPVLFVPWTQRALDALAPAIRWIPWATALLPEPGHGPPPATINRR